MPGLTKHMEQSLHGLLLKKKLWEYEPFIQKVDIYFCLQKVVTIKLNVAFLSTNTEV